MVNVRQCFISFLCLILTFREATEWKPKYVISLVKAFAGSNESLKYVIDAPSVWTVPRGAEAL